MKDIIFKDRYHKWKIKHLPDPFNIKGNIRSIKQNGVGSKITYIFNLTYTFHTAVSSKDGKIHLFILIMWLAVNITQ